MDTRDEKAIEELRNWIRANPKLDTRERARLLSLAAAYSEQRWLNVRLVERCSGLVEIVASRAAATVPHPCG